MWVGGWVGGRREGLSSYNHKMCSLGVTLHNTTHFGMLYST